MKFRVVVTQKAKDDLRYYFSVAARHAPETAARWLDRFETTLQSLAENPARCSLAPENDLIKEPIYQRFFGKRVGRFRVLFTIEDTCVQILPIRRGTMDNATEDDLLA